MERLIGLPSTVFVDKIKNVVFAFFIMLVWVFSITAFLQFLLDPSTQFSYAPPAKFVFFFSCIWAPIWEEWAFRWVPVTIARAFNPQMMFPVVLLSSLIFGWGHGYGPTSLLIQGVMGFVLACVYLKNGNLIYSILLHSMWNSFCFFILPRIN